jgi:class 3 adenylate cyclase
MERNDGRVAGGRMTAVAACRTCGTEPLENARFCHSCGSPVDDGDAHAEYKQVTVLFADVVHSMDIASAAGAERLREIMTELVNRCAGVVQRFGGTVDKFTGDGIMAVFGAVVGVVGSPGIGKSRLVREVFAMAATRRVDVFTAFCESHTSQVPFHTVARLLRAVTGIKGLDPDVARARVRPRWPAKNRGSTSSRTPIGSMRSASRCWPTSSW